MRADLHMHSVWSDGKFSPETLICRAKQLGLGLVSVTDHDNLGGLSEKRAAARAQGLLYVSGWEVSAYEGNCKVHMLGYCCEPNGAYDDFLAERKKGALLRAADMIEKANACFGLGVSMEDAEREHPKKESPLHTMCVVNAFAKRLGADPGALYRTAFSAGCPAYSGLCRPTPEEAIEVIHASGGIASLAHPGRIRLDKEKRTELMERLAERGLDGVECYYTAHTPAETEEFLSFARARGLLVTGGSDFHTDDGIHFIGKPDFTPDRAALARLL